MACPIYNSTLETFVLSSMNKFKVLDSWNCLFSFAVSRWICLEHFLRFRSNKEIIRVRKTKVSSWFVIRAGNFWMVDIRIKTWSTRFLNLELNKACSPLVIILQINWPIGIKDIPFSSFQLRLRFKSIVVNRALPSLHVESLEITLSIALKMRNYLKESPTFCFIINLLL